MSLVLVVTVAFVAFADAGYHYSPPTHGRPSQSIYLQQGRTNHRPSPNDYDRPLAHSVSYKNYVYLKKDNPYHQGVSHAVSHQPQHIHHGHNPSTHLTGGNSQSLGPSTGFILPAGYMQSFPSTVNINYGNPNKGFSQSYAPINGNNAYSQVSPIVSPSGSYGPPLTSSTILTGATQSVSSASSNLNSGYSVTALAPSGIKLHTGFVPIINSNANSGYVSTSSSNNYQSSAPLSSSSNNGYVQTSTSSASSNYDNGYSQSTGSAATASISSGYSQPLISTSSNLNSGYAQSLSSTSSLSNTYAPSLGTSGSASLNNGYAQSVSTASSSLSTGYSQPASSSSSGVSNAYAPTSLSDTSNFNSGYSQSSISSDSSAYNNNYLQPSVTSSGYSQSSVSGNIGLSSGYSQSSSSNVVSQASDGYSESFTSPSSSSLSSGDVSSSFDSNLSSQQSTSSIGTGLGIINAGDISESSNLNSGIVENSPISVSSNVQQAPAIFKHIYFHVPPPEIEEPQNIVLPPPPKKNYKIIFIKVPSQESRANVARLQQMAQMQNAAIEHKTLIYVLVKKPEDQQSVVIPNKTPSKHEVFFVKYNGNPLDLAAQVNEELDKTGSVQSVVPLQSGLVNGHK